MANLTPSTKRIAHDALKSRLREINAEKPIDTVKILKRADAWGSLPDAVKKIIANSTRNRFSTYKKKIASVEKAIKEIKYADEKQNVIHTSEPKVIGNWLQYEQLQPGKRYLVGGTSVWIGAEVMVYKEWDHHLLKHALKVMTYKTSPSGVPALSACFGERNYDVRYKEICD